MNSYRDLLIWQKGMTLAARICDLCRSPAKGSANGLTEDMRHCAVSIPCSVARGYGSGSRREYLRLLRAASASLCELETQAELVAKLGGMTDSDVDGICESGREIGRMIGALIRKLNEAPDRGSSQPECRAAPPDSGRAPARLGDLER